MGDQIRSLPAEWWLGGIAILFVATASGFIAGFYCARWSERRAFEQALSLYERRGNVVMAARVRALLAELMPHPTI